MGAHFRGTGNRARSFGDEYDRSDVLYSVLSHLAWGSRDQGANKMKVKGSWGSTVRYGTVPGEYNSCLSLYSCLLLIG